MMSHAPQRDCASKASRSATDDDKADPKSCLLCGFMTTPLNKASIRYTERRRGKGDIRACEERVVQTRVRACRCAGL